MLLVLELKVLRIRLLLLSECSNSVSTSDFDQGMIQDGAVESDERAMRMREGALWSKIEINTVKIAIQSFTVPRAREQANE